MVSGSHSPVWSDTVTGLVSWTRATYMKPEDRRVARSRSMRGRAALGVALAVLIAACSGGIADPEPTSTSLGFVSEPTAQPIAEPTPTEEPEPTAKPLSVKVVKQTKSVRRNGTASVTIKTSKGAKCDIDVHYATAISEAKGLGDKKANADGQVTWKWKVGGKTTLGTWPIFIECTLGDRAGETDTEFTVK